MSTTQIIHLMRGPDPVERDPGWGYDMNAISAELDKALTSPADEAERITVLILRRLYVPAESTSQALRALAQNFFAIRKTLRDEAGMKQTPALPSVEKRRFTDRCAFRTSRARLLIDASHFRAHAKEMDPSHAVATAYELFAALTGAPVSHMIARRRGAVVDTARNLACYHVYEIVGRTQPEGWLDRTSRAGRRNHSTVRACALKYDWPLGAINKKVKGEWVTTEVCDPTTAADIYRLLDWAEQHWREPLAIHRDLIAKARARFRATLRYWRRKRRSKAARPGDIVRAVASMARALPKEEPVSTAVPIVDDPLPMRMLRQAPVAQDVQELSCEAAYGGGWYISGFVAGAGKKMEDTARGVLQDIARMFDGARFKARQSAFSPVPGGGWKAVLHVAAASVLFGLSPLFAPVDANREYSHV